MELGNTIKALRTEKGITQEKLAEILSVSAQAVSKWECGASTPDIQLLPKLAIYFGVTIDELFGLTDDQELERIENMIWEHRMIPEGELQKAQRWLLDRIDKGYKVGKCFVALADLDNHQANVLREEAAEYAKQAIAADPYDRDAHRELEIASEGPCHDWCVSNHYQLIAFYEDFIAKHPDCPGGYINILDGLIDAGRFREAELYVQRFKEVDDSCRPVWYESVTAWYAGDRERAHRIWERLEQDFPDDWLVSSLMGDMLAREQRYDEAVACYRKSLAQQEKPRYTDGYESIAQIGEITGDLELSIAALTEELELLREDWNAVSGESVDRIHRWIRRLRGEK